MIGIVTALLLTILTPWRCDDLPSYSNPAADYPAALLRIQQWQNSAVPSMNPLCQLTLMTHHHATERGIVLVHGYTSCPRQFYSLGQQFYHAGYNVLIAPLPYHGDANRFTHAHGQLTAEALTQYADRALDIAHGLGRRITMMGLSAGGVVTAWAAHHRSDIEQAIMIAPAFSFKPIPLPLTTAAMNLFSILPDSFVAWQPTNRIDDTPNYAYPEYSYHALAQILRLSCMIKQAAQHTAPATRRLVFVLNPNDQSVNNDAARELAARWRNQYQVNLTIIDLPDQLKLAHDFISSERPHQFPELVYPRLLDAAGVHY
ncbi:alpha/beta hydrolase [Thiospirillum jenense]|uniref:alpha/beta hydrolase n=1 Tax=Thiospirillum jenense TaxID=1653858 RepID=UPI0030B7F968